MSYPSSLYIHIIHTFIFIFDIGVLVNAFTPDINITHKGKIKRTYVYNVYMCIDMYNMCVYVSLCVCACIFRLSKQKKRENQGIVHCLLHNYNTIINL